MKTIAVLFLSGALLLPVSANSLESDSQYELKVGESITFENCELGLVDTRPASAKVSVSCPTQDFKIIVYQDSLVTIENTSFGRLGKQVWGEIDLVLKDSRLGSSQDDAHLSVNYRSTW